MALDVTDPASIARTITDAGAIDVLVNNAGIGWLNALEGTPGPAARELEAFGIRARLVLPGRGPETQFGANARARMTDGVPDAYAGLAQRVFAGFQQPGPVTYLSDVAEAVWRAATDPACPMRQAAGADAVAWAEARESIDEPIR